MAQATGCMADKVYGKEVVWKTSYLTERPHRSCGRQAVWQTGCTAQVTGHLAGSPKAV